MWDVFVLWFAVTAAITDARWGRIPRSITTAGFFAGLAYHLAYGGFLASVAAAVLGFGIGLALFELRAIGGGDVKLITALGAMLGLGNWLLAMKVAMVLAALMAILHMIRRRVVLQTLRNVAGLMVHFVRNGLQPHAEITVDNPALVRVPFGVAAAVSVFYIVFTR